MFGEAKEDLDFQIRNFPARHSANSSSKSPNFQESKVHQGFEEVKLDRYYEAIFGDLQILQDLQNNRKDAGYWRG